jgi:hypothetical protein
MAVVKVAQDGGGATVNSSINREAVEDLGLAEGHRSLGPGQVDRTWPRRAVIHERPAPARRTPAR